MAADFRLPRHPSDLRAAASEARNIAIARARVGAYQEAADLLREARLLTACAGMLERYREAKR